MRNIIGDLKKILFWYILKNVISFIPLKAVYFIGDIGGYINSKLFKNMFKNMHAELSLVFNGSYSEEEKISIIDRAYKLGVKNQLEVLMFKSLDKTKTNRMIRIEGLEKLETALSRKKGVILLTAHFGANKLIMPALGYNGYRINQVAGRATEWIRIMGDELSLLSKRIYELEHENDHYLPANFIYVFESMKPVIRCLKNNEIVCLAIDGGGGIKKEKIRFLGREAMISEGPFRIAQKTGSAILPVFVVRQPDNIHRMTIEDPTLVNKKTDKEKNIGYLEEFINRLETYVKQYPCHYVFRLARARMLVNKDPLPLFTDYENRKPL